MAVFGSRHPFENPLFVKARLGSGHLSSQHSGGRVRRITGSKPVWSILEKENCPFAKEKLNEFLRLKSVAPISNQSLKPTTGRRCDSTKLSSGIHTWHACPQHTLTPGLGRKMGSSVKPYMVNSWTTK